MIAGMNLIPHSLISGTMILMASTVVAAPVARWDFGSEEQSKLASHGGVHRDVPGPRSPIYPDFETNNTAVQFDGAGAYFSFADPGSGSDFDFTNGDSITLEAWVNMAEIRAGENVYLIGKGRTDAPGFAADNQNWALRMREQKGKACLSFLFATKPEGGASKKDAHWHRWTTSDGFAAKSGWHHVAVTYRFGDPSSVRGWLDGKLISGNWDMGMETTQPPVVDDDAIWIGSAKGGAAANSFRGMLDAVAIHREILSEEVLKKRFRKEGAEKPVALAKAVMPEVGSVSPGKVLVSFHEAMPTHERWLNEDEKWPAETMRWETDHFVLSRLPLRYDAWGIREAWRSPLLVRLTADVTLPAGKHRFLMRARALGRLWVNGSLVAKTEGMIKSPPDGEEPIPPVLPPADPNLRPAAYWQQEAAGEVEIPSDGTYRVVLETVVGGTKLRAETSELCAAVQNADGKGYTVITPAGTTPLPLVNNSVEPALARLESDLAAFDDSNRRAAAASLDGFWKSRHTTAAQWAQTHPAPLVPAKSRHPIDTFLKNKMDMAVEASTKSPAQTALHFHEKVLPILRDECFRCHGEKEKGGLKLNSLANALKAGESEKPAVVPGAPQKSEIIARLVTQDEDERMPPKGEGLKADQIDILHQWIASGAAWPAPLIEPAQVAPSPSLNDAEFLRKVSLDLIGVPPTEKELRDFLADTRPDKRESIIDSLLKDDRWADSWLPYWLDVLAENPALLNATLNSTGPFRWFIQDALRDNKPMDRFVTELILMRGNQHTGGSAGFSMAGENDSPFATKGQIIASAFLGMELQCARCHDSPYHSTKQHDLYSLAAMLDRKAVTVPKTSMVPAAFFEKKSRESLIKVTMKPGESVPPAWPFAEVTGCSDSPALNASMQAPKDSRERLAALITSPENIRFAQVMVNRVWRRYMGAGFVEPVHDWEGHPASHPELLNWLAHEFVAHGYDLKRLTRIILTSETYQRAASGNNLAAAPELRFFNAPERRRLTAEQVVDSLYAASGSSMDVEEITFDPTGRRAEGARITLGTPKRAWMLASLTNERDRPSLSLPRAQCVTDVMEAFGWIGARQSSRTDRETAPNVLQPGVLANSSLSITLTRSADKSTMANLAVSAPTAEALVEQIFFRFLSRAPNTAELSKFSAQLSTGFTERLVPENEIQRPVPLPPLGRVTWYNHLRAEATTIAQENEKRARMGPPPDPRLRPEWREVYEDFVWSLINTREFVWLP